MPLIQNIGLAREHYTGAASESLAAAYFLTRGYQVYLPAAQQSSVDFVVYKDGCYQAVQVKTATWSKSGPFRYLQCRVRNASGNLGHFDTLAVIGQSSIWLIPRDEIHSSNLCLGGSRLGYQAKWDHRKGNLLGSP